MKKVFFICITFTVFIMPTTCFAGVDFILDLRPVSMLFSPDVDGFKVSRTSGSITESDTIRGSASYMPNLKAGLRINTSALNIDLTGGIGFLYNDAFHSSMYLADLALRFKISKHATIGPHVSVIKFDPTWDGSGSDSSDVKLSEETSMMPGLCFTVGGKTASFSASIDYIDTSFDVTTRNGWVANDTSIDMSGFAIQLGVLFSF
ncbi:MAG: hypothetical protein KJO26_04870 [Deltaproteobacteria bacterium]|nr:hypothetical protein [Deltaproteobacteria bacterium]NNK84766.1 hypothetical protein [Desulfobacterales bacterium]